MRQAHIALLLVIVSFAGLPVGCDVPSGAGRGIADGGHEGAPTAADGARPVTSSTAAPVAPVSPRTVEERALLRVVSKQAPLGAAYVPAELVGLPEPAVSPGLGTLQLTRPASEALLAMQVAARAAGLDVRVQSAYRSFEVQQQVHGALAARLGEPEASRRSAPPGYSEHQLGTVVDLTTASVGWGLNARFAATAEGLWLAANAPTFGFALSYPEGAEAVTGYVYEPWHLRFIGSSRAAEWQRSGVTLVEYLGRVGGASPEPSLPAPLPRRGRGE